MAEASDPQGRSDGETDGIGGGGDNANGNGGDYADPFAELVLDESFVKSAKVYEAPARSRAAVARYATSEGSGLPNPPKRIRDQEKNRRKARKPVDPARRRTQLVAAVGVVVLAGLAFAVLNPVGLLGDNGDADGDPASGAARSAELTTPDPEADEVTLNRQSYERGGCYTWNQDTHHTSADLVDCGEPHLFEAVEKTDVGDEFSPLSTFPTPDEWDVIADRYCLPIVEEYLGYPLDPFGKFRASMLSPVRDGWAAGDRQLTCGLIVAGTTFAESDRPYRLVSFTGAVSGADQSFVWPAGTCVELVGEESRAADCASPHHALVTGTATMPETSNGQPPSDVAYRELAVPLCEAVASDHLGPGYRPTGNEQVNLLVIRDESWRAGSRTFNCTIAYYDESGEPTTGTGLGSGGAVTA